MGKSRVNRCVRQPCLGLASLLTRLVLHFCFGYQYRQGSLDFIFSKF